MNQKRLRGMLFPVIMCAVFLVLASCSQLPPPGAEGSGDAPRADGAVSVTFTYSQEIHPGAIYIAGTLNEWNQSKDKLKDDDGDGIYEITLALDPGTYQYKFVIDGAWKEDPFSASYSDDGFGGSNSVLEVTGDTGEMTVGVSAGQKKPAKEKGTKAPAAGSVDVTFLFEAGTGVPANVCVAGTFNNWDQNADGMSDDDGDGIYEFTIKLAPGRYEYKFVRDGQWLTDESAVEFSDDGFGGRNSVLNVSAGDGEEGLRVGMSGELADRGQSAGQDPGGEKALKEVTFRFQPVISGVQNIFLAGTFNDWNDSKTRMNDEDGDGTYEATLLLPVGQYQYKFVADGRWITDESAEDFTDDGFGGKNSVLNVDDSFEEVIIELGDGIMMWSDIPLVLDYSMVNPQSRESIQFRTRAHTGDVEKVEILFTVNGGSEQAMEMKSEESDGIFQYYGTVLDIPVTSSVRFAFRYTDADVEYYARPGGIEPGKPEPSGMFEYAADIVKPFLTPDWAKDGVFYQIFPERFRNGDTSNDQDFMEPYYRGVTKLPSGGRTNGEYFHFVSQWGNVSGLSKSPFRTDGKPDYYSFYGGDIAGVMEKLPYLKDLGVTIIYFNPLNEARSNHKYDPVDYMKIDPHFADEETFKKFVRRAHELGIRIIVDKAFNHTGNWHFAFIDGREKGRESKFWQWYEWKRWPLPDGDIPNPVDYYDCWWGFGIHPNLNYDLSRPNSGENNITDISNADPNWPLVNYILDVARYWLGELGIDGFRLDVPNEVPFWVWYEFRKLIDEVNPDAFLIGEIWGNAMPWLGPNCFHSTMNYKYFRDPVLKYFALGKGNAAQLDRELAPGRSLYPIQATQVMMNLIGSHDTERFVTLAGNDNGKLRMAALFQMTYVGIPQIYYGDEIGLRGGKDPDCRRTFPWDWEQSPRRKEIHDWYKKIISIRHGCAALRTGSFRTLLAEGRVYSYMREDETDRIIVVLNNEGMHKRIELYLDVLGIPNGSRFVDELGGGEFTVSDSKLVIGIDGMMGAILVMKQ